MALPQAHGIVSYLRLQVGIHPASIQDALDKVKLIGKSLFQGRVDCVLSAATILSNAACMVVGGGLFQSPGLAGV